MGEFIQPIHEIVQKCVENIIEIDGKSIFGATMLEGDKTFAMVG